MAQRALNALVFVLALGLVPDRSWAAPPQLLVVRMSSCDTSKLDESAALHALRAELAADGVQRVVAKPPPKSSAPVLTVALACDAGLTVTVELRSAAGAQRRQSFALIDTVPEARPRAFALAVAEAVRLQWQELNPAPRSSIPSREAPAPPAEGQPALAAQEDAPPSNEVVGTAPADSVPSQAAAPAEPVAATATLSPTATRNADTPAPRRNTAPRGWALRAGARSRWFPDYQSASFGGHLGVDRGALRGELEALLSTPGDVLGQASLGIAAASGGYRVFDAPLGALQFGGYALASLGLTWARATPSEQGISARATRTFYGDLRVVVDARLRAHSLSPTLSLEAGRATGLAVRASDRTLGATGGFFLGASLGARY